MFNQMISLMAMAAIAAFMIGCTDSTTGTTISQPAINNSKLPHILAGTDKYSCFDSLKAGELSTAWRILSRSVDTAAARRIAFTIHGGGIEPGASEIADAIANDSTGADFNFYAFEGMKSSGNGDLHITSTNFDEPTALSMVGASTTTVSVHGCDGNTAIVYLGGRDTTLRNKIKSELDAIAGSDFTTSTSSPDGLGGSSAQNICNKNTPLAGTQLEISSGLRNKLMTSLSTRSGRISSRTQLFWKFIRAVRKGMQ
jgi:phage replication-related protein YjqB (UPF0714/DUF867 family)